MTHSTRTYVVGCILALALPAAAHADDSASPVSDAPDGLYSAQRGVQGPAGMFSARVLLDANLSAGRVGQPISLAPDLYYGVTDRLQLGLLHTGEMGWQARPGVGLCLTGASNGCPHVYDNIGFDAMYALVFGGFDLSLHSSLFFDSFDPTTTSLALGFAGKAHFGSRVALVFDPKIAIALDRRSVRDDFLYVPVELEYQVSPPTVFKLLSGFTGDVSAFGDTVQVPVGVGVVHNLNEHFDLGARFSFDNLLGSQPPGVSATDSRSLAVLLNIRA